MVDAVVQLVEHPGRGVALFPAGSGSPRSDRHSPARRAAAWRAHSRRAWRAIRISAAFASAAARAARRCSLDGAKALLQICKIVEQIGPASASSLVASFLRGSPSLVSKKSLQQGKAVPARESLSEYPPSVRRFGVGLAAACASQSRRCPADLDLRAGFAEIRCQCVRRFAARNAMGVAHTASARSSACRQRNGPSCAGHCPAPRPECPYSRASLVSRTSRPPRPPVSHRPRRRAPAHAAALRRSVRAPTGHPALRSPAARPPRWESATARSGRRHGGSAPSGRPASPAPGRTDAAPWPDRHGRRRRCLTIAARSSSSGSIAHPPNCLNSRSCISAAAALVKVRQRILCGLASAQQQPRHPIGQGIGLARAGIGRHPGGDVGIRARSWSHRAHGSSLQPDGDHSLHPRQMVVIACDVGALGSHTREDRAWRVPRTRRCGAPVAPAPSSPVAFGIVYIARHRAPVSRRPDCR